MRDIISSRLVIEGEGTLVIRKVSEADEGKYQCLAKNAVGTRGSLKATLTFQGRNKRFNLFSPTENGA